MRQRQSEIAEEMSKRGLGQSGPFYAAVNRTFLSLYHEYGTGLLADHLALAEDVNWDLDVVNWLEARYNDNIDGTARSLAQSLVGESSSSSDEAARVAGATLKRDSEIAFTRVRVRRGTAAQTAAPVVREREQRDFFISHAGEDREAVARPLAEELQRRGHSVWFSDYELTLGDSLLQKISRGLVESRYGVVVLSHSFFAKPWPQTELEGLAARAIVEGRKVILPVWHNITHAEIAKYSPPLADRLGIDTGRGIGVVADEIVRASKADPTH